MKNLTMKNLTIEVTLDRALLAALDEAAAKLGIERARFIRLALESAVQQHAVEQLEARHMAGYTAQPAADDEIVEWGTVRAWGEA
jgi:metal-responsive CopG/Arc/MetJ family transcriptional regulator